MKYQVTMQRQEFRTHTFEVEADSLEEAETKAEEASWDYNWLDSSIEHADEEIISSSPAGK